MSIWSVLLSLLPLLPCPRIYLLTRISHDSPLILVLHKKEVKVTCMSHDHAVHESKPLLCMSTPSSRLSNPTSACPHPVQGCRTLLRMPTPSSRHLNPSSACPPHTQFNASSACTHPLSNPTSTCSHPVQCYRTPQAVKPHLCKPTPSSRQSNMSTCSSRLLNPTSTPTPSSRPVEGCRTPPLHAHTQFKTPLHAYTQLCRDGIRLP
jgi:hypothetical protein